MKENPLVSVVIPVFNEAVDICNTLDALLALRYPNREIIVVDDGSTDNTPAILQRYVLRGVTVLRRKPNQGRSRARNVGILRAQGEIVVILNADVMLPSDFLERIVAHYRAGADYVLVESQGMNIQHLFPRFLDAQAHHNYQSDDSIEWTEGYSCRRQVALDVGLFPDGYPLPLCSGEDAVFGYRVASRYRKVVDRTIVVTHVIPETLHGYWAQQWERGRATPILLFFVRNMNFFWLCLRSMAKTLRSIVKLALIMPGFWHSARIIRWSERVWRDVLPFWYAYNVQLIAMTLGEWDGVLAIWQEMRRGNITGVRWKQVA